METNQKIQSIMQALQMREETIDPIAGRISKPTIDAEDRKSLVAELVKLLITVA